MEIQDKTDIGGEKKADIAVENRLGLPNEEKIEELYYRAVKDAKLDNSVNETGQEQGPPGYPTEDFIQWARKIDIYTLGKGAADFSTEKHRQIVKEFEAYRHNVVTKLAEQLTYESLPLHGHLRDIGSCIDGSKVGSVNEMDSLYVMQGESLTIEKHNGQNLYHVYVGKDSTRYEIQPRRLRKQLAETYGRLVYMVKLPDCIQHGGYKCSSAESHQASCNEHDKGPQVEELDYSGLRYNGPAVTSQFLTKDNTLLTWDITPVVALSDEGIRERVNKSDAMQAITSDNPEKMFPIHVHLFPDSTANLWRVTTAEMEASMLGRMSRHAPFKVAFCSCKVLSTELKVWHNKKASLTSADVDVVDALIQYGAMKDSAAKTEAAEILNRKMRFAHIWIPTDRREEYKEDKKSNISVNNAAVKHRLLKVASRRKGAFGPDKNPDLVMELIRSTFEELGNDNIHSTEHAFIPGMQISYFSVAPGMASYKLTLARDISRQCRTLVQEAMTNPLATSELEQTIDDLNKCAVEQIETRCPEYSFKMTMNPLQHPEMDKNIHHLFALVTSLCQSCGGVIFFTTADDPDSITTEVIERFQSRLAGLLEKTENLPQNKINFLQVPLCLRGQGVWAAVHLKRSKPTLPSDSWGYSKLVHMDLHGLVQIEETSNQQDHVEPSSAPRVTLAMTDDTDEIDGNGLAADTSLSHPENKSSKLPSSSDDATNLPVDFFFLNKLDWSKNKNDWERYIHGKTPTIDTIVNACSLWKPTTPMTVTPDRATLQSWFASAKDLDETLLAVDTKEPGFAIVCKTWNFHISNNEAASRPAGHICDILTVSNNCKICLWAVCSDCDISCQMEYLLTTGRMIKYRLVHAAGEEDLSNLCIECRLLCPDESARSCVSSAIEESLEIQNQIWAFCNEGIKLNSLQRALAFVILCKESPLKRPVGNQTAIMLSVQQVEVLLNKDTCCKVKYVSGPAGSGKSYTAALLCQMHGTDNSVYICTTNEFAEYLRFSGHKGTVVQTDKDLLREIKVGTFKNKTCIIIDDSHNFACTKSSMKKLFKLIKLNKEMHLYVFADNDYQSFDKKRQQAMRNCIRDLSLQVLGKEPHYAYLTAIYRNTKKVVSFVQSAIQNSYEDHQKIECQNMEIGDGIECVRMENIWLHSRQNDLVDYVHNICAAERYKITEIAILLDPSYTSDQIQECRSILREHLPNSCAHSAAIFPRRGVVVDSASSFLGLDSPFCVFILPQKTKRPSFLRRLFKRGGTGPDANICNPRFKVFMASRATHKAVFVVPRMDAEIVKELKFDLFELAVDYHGLAVRGRREIQAGYSLQGLCYSEGRLFVAEWQQVESGRARYSLAVYQVHRDSGDLTLLDRMELWTGGLSWSVSMCPRVDRHIQRVFVPSADSGVTVAHLDNDRLVRGRTLTCVRVARSVDVMSPDIVYVVDGSSRSVCVVDVRDDKIVSTLEKPETVNNELPRSLAVLSDSVMVSYGASDHTLVVYSHASPTPVRVIPRPGRLQEVIAASTDWQSNFLLTEYKTKSVFVMDTSGNVHHTVNIDTDRWPRDCAVVNRQLWVGCLNGDIIIMSSE